MYYDSKKFPASLPIQRNEQKTGNVTLQCTVHLVHSCVCMCVSCLERLPEKELRWEEWVE